MPGLGRKVSEGGVGFDYRLGMGLPNLWHALTNPVRSFSLQGRSSSSLARSMLESVWRPYSRHRLSIAALHWSSHPGAWHGFLARRACEAALTSRKDFLWYMHWLTGRLVS